jgi:defect in organelle trafficking protein DotD
LMFGLLLCVAGCQSRNATVTAVPQVNPTDVVLIQASDTVTQALTMLSRSNLTSEKKPFMQNVTLDYLTSIGLDNITTVHWVGPFEPLVKQLAMGAHYHVRVLGKAPVTPCLVTVHMSDVPVGNILYQIGYQVNQQARMVLMAHSKTIEIRYAT